MIAGQLDAATRAGAVATILLLAWLLFHHRRKVGLPAMLFPPMALCVSGFVVDNTPVSALRPAGMVGTVAHAVSGFTVVFLWWFCLSCFDSRFRLRGAIVYVGIGWAVIAALDRGLLGNAMADRGLSVVLVLMGFAIVGHLVWRLLAERQGDLIQQRHDARIVVAVLLGGMLFVDLAADALFGFAWRPLAFSMSQNAMVLAFGVWLAGRLLTVRVDALALRDEERAPLSSGDASRPRQGSNNVELRRRLTDLMEGQRIFLDPDLTFATFVERMGASERAVRTLVNDDRGFDHFRNFLNHYRLAEARRLLEDGGHSGDKLIAIAFDSGFASLASFNRTFRAAVGCTPSQYRAAAGQGVAADEWRQAGSGERKTTF